ncbi:Ribonuclease Y [Symmachiella macrocystis]|uniref:Ribonuclease Y n=1 Tax=Symmachiella macrocystis TaxID=2527985 RepID=A0A5C6B6T4_9PLAN|nr:ribonuclease Y [Symmachiella macrocystis]TWU07231.1 Ribonuclease Y [Symmachiella macrocystis]
MGNAITAVLAVSETVTAISAALALIVGLGIGLVIERISRGAAYQRRDEIIEQARQEAENVKKSQELEAKEELIGRREAVEKELNSAREEQREQERRLDRRETTLGELQQDINKKERMIEGVQTKLADRQKQMDAREAELEQVLREERDQLFQISGLSPEAAQDKLLTQLRVELKNETGAVILKHNQELKETCDKLAREAVGMAVQRCAASHASETTVSTVDIPNDDMKGRIIGREGRNIRAFEKITGVDVIVDDTPGVVIVSAFDTVRREIARLSLTKLIQDGRIHPSRIEEIVNETEKEMDEHIRTLGNEAIQEAGIVDVHEKLIMLMGRLNFRVSYSQNVRRHSIEVAYLTGLLAESLGLDGTLARRCGFFHDIGKAADHEMEGGHPAVGAELLKRYGEGPEVVHAAFGHHDDIRVDHIYTVLVASADAISAARPGARRETLEKYVRRLEELEALACGFPGVDHAYAVQAGREVRCVVDAKQVNDREAAKMCRDIAKGIEQALTYPGEIKVTVLRETRTIQYAK